MQTTTENLKYEPYKKLESEINEELAVYLTSSNIDVQKRITFKEFLQDKMLVITAIKKGIPYSLFDSIQHNTPFSETDWAEILDISKKSLQRYKVNPDHHFKPIHSEKILEIAEVTEIGIDVFGSLEKFKLWLDTPNYALGKLKPVELLKDSYGKEMVVSELTCINHGILV